MNNIEQKRTTYDKWFKIGLVALGALIISPIIFLVVKGIVGLVIAGVIGLIVVNFAPVVSMKLANWKVRGIVAEAKENPIETMINLLNEKKVAYRTFKTSVETAVTASKTFEQKCKDFAQKYPARADEFVVQVAAMKQLVEKKKIALQQAQAMLIDGDNKLEEMQAYWSMSQAAQEANKAAGMSTGDQFEKLKSDTACDSVFESMNRAFAELEVAAALDAPALENNPSMNVNFIDVKSKVVVQ
jgi:hypothetical protein